MESAVTSNKNYTIKPHFLSLLLRQLRPKQWSKNFLVFAALVFSINYTDLQMIIKSVIAFFLFSLVSGSVYTLNDFIDRESDRQHPDKRKRPIASGMLNPYKALCCAAIILIVSLAASLYINTLFFIVLLLYFIVNICYSLKFKHIVILDIMTIAICFVLRAVAGGVAIGVRLTPWFLTCAFLLALFLSINKRRHELILLQDNVGNHRKVLAKYSTELINQLNSIATTATLVTYALFTFTSGHSTYLMFTIPFVVYGIFRYLYLIYMEEKGGKPEKLLFEDKHILITVLSYAVTVLCILYIWG